jgi:hypothetical protein
MIQSMVEQPIGLAVYIANFVGLEWAKAFCDSAETAAIDPEIAFPKVWTMAR